MDKTHFGKPIILEDPPSVIKTDPAGSNYCPQMVQIIIFKGSTGSCNHQRHKYQERIFITPKRSETEALKILQSS